MDNYQFFLQANLDAYVGQWVAVANERIVASGTDFKRVLAQTKNQIKGTPFIARVPDKQTMIF